MTATTTHDEAADLRAALEVKRVELWESNCATTAANADADRFRAERDAAVLERDQAVAERDALAEELHTLRSVHHAIAQLTSPGSS